MNFLIQGWLLGVAYVAPIGMQNMYIINTSMEKPYSHAIKVALIMIFFDISLGFFEFREAFFLFSDVDCLSICKEAFDYRKVGCVRFASDNHELFKGGDGVFLTGEGT